MSDLPIHEYETLDVPTDFYEANRIQLPADVRRTHGLPLWLCETKDGKPTGRRRFVAWHSEGIGGGCGWPGRGVTIVVNTLTIIGYYRVEKETVFDDRHFERACDWQQIRVPAGRYPIVGNTVRGTNYIEDTSLHVAMPGTVVACYFPNLWAGVAFGRQTGQIYVGTQAIYRLSPYAHSLAHALLEPEKNRHFDTSVYELTAVEPVLWPYAYSYTQADGTQEQVAGCTAKLVLKA